MKIIIRKSEAEIIIAKDELKEMFSDQKMWFAYLRLLENIKFIVNDIEGNSCGVDPGYL